MIVIGARYCGPPDSGNGGYSSGIIAGALRIGPGAPIEVTLRSPPPLDTPLEVDRFDGGLTVNANGVTVGEARIADFDAEDLGLDVPPAPAFDEAREASRRYPWSGHHPYPTCFVCGPDRAEGDGLRIFPGAVEGHRFAAAPWLPHESVSDGGLVHREVMWAALDCPSWLGYAAFSEWTGRPLLGRLTADIRSLPRVGERCVVAGWTIAREGRKIDAAAVVWAEDGSIHGISRARWILVDQPADPPSVPLSR